MHQGLKLSRIEEQRAGLAAISPRASFFCLIMTWRPAYRYHTLNGIYTKHAVGDEYPTQKGPLRHSTLGLLCESATTNDVELKLRPAFNSVLLDEYFDG